MVLNNTPPAPLEFVQRGFGGTNTKQMNFIFTSREEWLSQRKKGVGSSDISAIMGCSSFKTALDIYESKIKDHIEDVVVKDWNNPLYRGQVYEPLIARFFQETTGLVIHKGELSIQGLKPHYLASPDYLTESGAPVECKTTMLYISQPLDEWMMQTIWQCGNIGASEFYIAAITGGWKHQIWHFEFDDFCKQEFERYCDGADDFWQCVETRTPPESNKFTASIGSTLEASECLAGRLSILRTKKQAHEELSDEIEALTEEVKLVMRENEILTINGAIAATWKQSKPRETVDTKKLKAEFPDVFELVKKTGEPVRTFKLK